MPSRRGIYMKDELPRSVIVRMLPIRLPFSANYSYDTAFPSMAASLRLRVIDQSRILLFLLLS
jgi:hypothetical protein